MKACNAAKISFTKAETKTTQKETAGSGETDWADKRLPVCHGDFLFDDWGLLDWLVLRTLAERSLERQRMSASK